MRPNVFTVFFILRSSGRCMYARTAGVVEGTRNGTTMVFFAMLWLLYVCGSYVVRRIGKDYGKGDEEDKFVVLYRRGDAWYAPCVGF